MPRPSRWRKRLGKWTGAVSDIMRLAPPRHRVLVVVGSFVSSLLDLIGLTMMVPLIIAATDVQGPTKGIVVALQNILGGIGLPFTPAAILTIIIVGLTLKALAGVLVTRYVNQVVVKVTRDMRIRMIRSLLGARWGYFVRQPVGRLAFAIGPEAEASGQSFEALTTLIASCLQVLVFVAIIALLSWQLLLIAIVAACIVGLWFGGLVRQSRREAKERRQEARQRTAKFTDTLIGIKPIRAMGRADQFADLFEDEARSAAKGARGRIMAPEYAADLQEPVIGALLAVGFYLAITRLSLQIHDLLIMSILIVKTIAALMPMQRVGQRFIQSYDQYRSLNRLLETSESARETWSGHATPDLRREITFEQVGLLQLPFGEYPDAHLIRIRRNKVNLADPSDSSLTETLTWYAADVPYPLLRITTTTYPVRAAAARRVIAAMSDTAVLDFIKQFPQYDDVNGVEQSEFVGGRRNGDLFRANIASCDFDPRVGSAVARANGRHGPVHPAVGCRLPR